VQTILAWQKNDASPVLANFRRCFRPPLKTVAPERG